MSRQVGRDQTKAGGSCHYARTAGLMALCVALSSVVGCRHAPAARLEAREYAPGMTRREFVDPGRGRWSGEGPRPITTLVWYPTDASPAETLRIGPPDAPLFDAGVVAGDAAIARGGRRPLVLLSHGTGGSALQMAWLGIGLARAGFIAAAVNHHGNTGAEPPFDARGFFLWWERADDLRVALDRLLADPVLGPHVDSARVAAVGFSLGGYTVLSVAGGRTDLAAFRAFCESAARDFTCGPQPEFPDAPERFARVAGTDSAARASLARAGDSHADPRVRAAVALAPAVAKALTPPSLGSIRVPLLLVVGDSDHVAPPATNARYVAAAVPGARFLAVPRAGHYVFLDRCTDRGRQLIPATCADAEGVDRARVHEHVVATVARFLRDALGAP